MRQIILEAQEDIKLKAVQNFKNKLKTVKGYITAYDDRPEFIVGLPWTGETKSSIDQVKTTRTGIGTIINIERINDRCALIHSEIEYGKGDTERILHLAEI